MNWLADNIKKEEKPTTRERTEEEILTAYSGRGLAWVDGVTRNMSEEETFGKNNLTLEELSVVTGIRPYHLNLAYLGMAKLNPVHTKTLEKYLLEGEIERFMPVKGRLEPMRLYNSSSPPRHKYELVPRMSAHDLKVGDLLFYTKAQSGGVGYWTRVADKFEEPLFWIITLEGGMRAIIGKDAFMRTMKLIEREEEVNDEEWFD